MREVRLLYGATIPGMPLLSSDLLWKIQFQAVDPIFFCEFSKGKPIILVSSLEYERARKEAKNCEAVLIKPYMDRANSRLGIDGLVEFLKEYNVGRVVVPGDMPSFITEKLRSFSFIVEIQGPETLWYPERAVKSQEEIEYISEVQKQTDRVLSEVVRKLRRAIVACDGTLIDKKGKVITAESIRDFMEVEFVKNGCLATNTIVACGDQAVDPHCYGYGPLRANLPIVMDVFPRSKKNWYWSDITRTFFKGEPILAARRMYQAVLDAQRLAMDMIHAGVNGSTIQKAVSEFFVENGYNTGIQDGTTQGFFHSVGHSVGLDIHELPMISRSPFILREGCVVTVEPGLYYLGVGGIRIEDVVVVEKDGARSLTSFPKELEDMIIP